LIQLLVAADAFYELKRRGGESARRCKTGSIGLIGFIGSIGCRSLLLARN